MRYPTNGEFDLDTCLTPTVFLDSDPLEPSYLSYHVESDPSEPSYPSMICLTSDSSSSSIVVRHAPPPVRGHGFIHTRAVPHGRRYARGGGRGDVASGGFGNVFLPSDG